MNYDVRIGRITEVLPPLRDDHQIHDHVFDETRVVYVMDVRALIRFCACGVATSNGIPNLIGRARVRVPW